MYSKKILKELLDFAENLAIKAGEILLNEQNKLKIVKFKDVQDIATSADIASEKYTIDAILKKFPKHSILSEEAGEINPGSEFRWVIDPLDGTKEYFRRIPLYNFSAALEYKSDTIISVVYRPTDENLYSGGKGLGMFLNKKPAAPSNINSLDKAFVYCYLPSFARNQDKYDEAWESLRKIGKKVYRLRSISDGNTALSWLASGSLEAYVNLSNAPKWHDIAPGLFLAKEAGAILSDSKGNKLENGNVATIIAVNNKYIHQELLTILNN